ncbi:MAG: cob(I)yrinic acid a,c-diamide adenosyltransferase [Promethearchaeota archaeon]
MSELKIQDRIKKYKLKRGFIHYYYGDGAGKSTSTFGTILRAIGHGLKPILIQFLKKTKEKEDTYTEIDELRRIDMDIDIDDLVEKYKSFIIEKEKIEDSNSIKSDKTEDNNSNDGIDEKSLNKGFSSKGFEYGEYYTMTHILDIPVIQLGTPRFIFSGEKPTEEHKLKSEFGLELIERLLKSDVYDIVVLDEIITAVNFKIVDEDRLVRILKEKKPNIEVFLTGRGAIGELMELADYITEFKKVKHPFDKGIYARKGIEY